jgi:dihydroorotase
MSYKSIIGETELVQRQFQLIGEKMAEKTQQTRKFIDPHVHCRDWNEQGKSTIAEVMNLARSQGIVAIFDMPNTKPPILTKSDVELRLWTAESQKSESGYYTYIAATSNQKQLRKAADVVKRNPKVVGIKMFAGISNNRDLSIIDPEEQKYVYKTLKQEKYNGVIAVHCEEESLGRPELWAPANPSTWNLAKPPIMEIKGVENQIRFAKETGFEGHLHIAHTSTP